MHKKIKIVYGNSLRVLTLVDKLIGEFYFLLCVILYFSNFLRPLDARGYIAVLFLLRKKNNNNKVYCYYCCCYYCDTIGGVEKRGGTAA